MCPNGDALNIVTAFIWDIDGVVVDSPHEIAWRETAKRDPWNVDDLSSDFYFTHVASRPRYEGGHNILDRKGVYVRLGAATEEARNALLDRYCTEKNAFLRQLIDAGRFSLFADAVTVLLNARSAGVRQAAASASKNARGMLARVSRSRIVKEVGDDQGVLGADDSLLSACDVDACGLDVGDKRDLLRVAAERLGTLSDTPPQAFVVFEDAPSGIEAAKSLGYHAVGILRIGDEQALLRAGAAVVVRDLRAVAAQRYTGWAG